MRLLVLLAALALPAPLSAAQLTDLQPGRNFPAGQDEFGEERSENIDVGDVDNDGDRDVGVANGGDGGPQPNRIFVNLGGAQGGTLGTWADESAARLAGVPLDTSRDIEFVDLEADGDLDVYIVNRDNTANGGEVSRAYTNLGGAQGGAIGFFTESTHAFWGTLVSVPASDEVGVVDGQGPWKNFAGDADFADFDDDGDVDLFCSAYGANISGTEDSRIFLNDGNGRFHEAWPWADAGADVRVHTIDTDLADIDGDFDFWMINYAGGGGGNLDRLLVNRGDGTFTIEPDWILGDPNFDENEVDFFDYDSDGDLDAYVANYLGTNWLYTSSLAQGVPPAQGLYHRHEASGSLAPWPELPDSGNGFNSLDGELADMDLDGDPDILLSNDFNQDNRYYENVLGVPDTFAPTFHALTQQGDKSDGSDTVIHAAVRDNAAHYLVATYRGQLVYSVDGGPERCMELFAQGSQQFRAVIPGGLTGRIAWRVEVTDDAGNTGVSPTRTYQQSGGAPAGWESLSCGTPGVDGVPALAGKGSLTPGAPTQVVLQHAAPGAFAVLFVSLASSPVPFKLGTLHPFPAAALLGRATGAGGLDHLAFPWPDAASLPSGSTLYLQYGIADAAHPTGATLSNAVRATVP